MITGVYPDNLADRESCLGAVWELFVNCLEAVFSVFQCGGHGQRRVPRKPGIGIPELPRRYRPTHNQPKLSADYLDMMADLSRLSGGVAEVARELSGSVLGVLFDIANVG